MRVSKNLEKNSLTLTRQTQTHVTERYKFEIADKHRERIRHYRRPEEADRGANRSRTDDGGPLAGEDLVLIEATRILYHRHIEPMDLWVPDKVAMRLFDLGAQSVGVKP